MRLTRETEYGVKALVALARKPPGTLMQLAEIAASEDLPGGFLAKIFPKLVRAGLVQSRRGSARGYTLSRAPRAISVREILEAVEGANLFQRCIFWSNQCDETHRCLLHHQWREIRPRVRAALGRLTLRELAAPRGLEGGRRKPAGAVS